MYLALGISTELSGFAVKDQTLFNPSKLTAFQRAKDLA